MPKLVLSKLRRPRARHDHAPAAAAATAEALVAHGAEIVQPLGADAPEITVRFRDPGGNVIGVYQQPSA